MKRNIRIIVLALGFIAIVNLLGGCYYFKVTTSAYPDKAKVLQQVATQKTFVIHEGIYEGAKAYYASGITITNDSVKGEIMLDYIMPYNKTAFPEVNSTVRYRRSKGEATLLNEVHMYLPTGQQSDGSAFLQIFDESKFQFAVGNIIRLDVYNPNTGATILSWSLAIAAGLMILPFILVGILLVFGASCPYIYVNTGNGFELAGEIYSGAISAPMERDDYLLLSKLVEEDGKYLLKITNELDEIQHTNLTQLMVIDHDRDVDVLVDKYGEPHSIRSIEKPVKVTNLNGDDISSVLSAKDELQYVGPDLTNNPQLRDGIILTYNIPEDVTKAKVVIKAKNSLWLDYAFQRMQNLFGGNYNDWAAKQDGIKKPDLYQWTLDQNIPLSVYVEDNNEWIRTDHFNLAGPLALKDDILEINIPEHKSGTIRIKLESGAYFWEIDYVALDITENVPLNVEVVKIEKALTESEDLVSDNLRYDDMKYYVQEEKYEMADLQFIAPDLKGEQRSIVLHSKGYYIRINDSKSKPKISQLRKFKEEGYFLEFSKNLIKTINEEFSPGVLE